MKLVKLLMVAAVMILGPSAVANTCETFCGQCHDTEDLIGSEGGVYCEPCQGGTQTCYNYTNYKQCFVRFMVGKNCITDEMMVQCDGGGSYADWESSC
jgi:hypothetical protein